MRSANRFGSGTRSAQAIRGARRRPRPAVGVDRDRRMRRFRPRPDDVGRQRAYVRRQPRPMEEAMRDTSRLGAAGGIAFAVLYVVAFAIADLPEGGDSDAR